MNQDEAKLEQQLREATSSLRSDASHSAPNPPRAGERKPPDDAASPFTSPFATTPRDPETAALAEGWQALSQLLEAANADFHPEAIVKQLRRRLMRQRMWRGALLAAVLLFGIGITWFANRGGAGGQPGLPARDGAVVTQPIAHPNGGDKLTPAAKVAATPATPAPTPAATVVAESKAATTGWDQTLDQEITQADESVHSGDTLSNRSDDSIDKLDAQLLSFSKEVAAESL